IASQLNDCRRCSSRHRRRFGCDTCHRGDRILIVIPMAIWSVHFKHSGAAPILVSWTILISVGMICSMVNLYSINVSSNGPLKKFRFCSLGYNASLPYSADPVPIVNQFWNDTMWTYFHEQNPSLAGYLYPCLSANNILPQPGALTIVRFFDVETTSPLYWGMNIISAIIYGCVPLSIFFSVVIPILRFQGHKSAEWIFDPTRKTSWRSRLKNFSIGAVNIYGKILSPFVFIVFLVWVEWIISYDLQAETMQEVGQWAPLVGVALSLVAAVIGKYWPRVSTAWDQRKMSRGDGYIELFDSEEPRVVVGEDEQTIPQTQDRSIAKFAMLR
ncbi:hypothetical protein BKA65DRAFT_581228, partial [Rhexocercosporidium sp. MPI-PUGE-AT-0058]